MNNIETLKCGLEVTQDHSNLYYSKAWVRFTILYCCLSNAMHRQNINLSVCVCLSVCVSITLSVNSPTGRTPQRIFTVDILKDADLRKDVPFGGFDDE